MKSVISGFNLPTHCFIYGEVYFSEFMRFIKFSYFNDKIDLWRYSKNLFDINDSFFTSSTYLANFDIISFEQHVCNEFGQYFLYSESVDFGSFKIYS